LPRAAARRLSGPLVRDVHGGRGGARRARRQARSRTALDARGGARDARAAVTGGRVAAGARARTRRLADGGAAARVAHPRSHGGQSVLRDRAAEDAVRAGHPDRRSGDEGVDRFTDGGGEWWLQLPPTLPRPNGGPTRSPTERTAPVLIRHTLAGRALRRQLVSHLPRNSS